MVKTIASILISLALLIGATVFETVFINTQFAEVRAALEAQGFVISDHANSEDWSAFTAKK